MESFKQRYQRQLDYYYSCWHHLNSSKANNLRDNVITKEDELIYAKIMHKAGMDPNSLKTSTKYKTIIKGVDTLTRFRNDRSWSEKC